MKHTGMQINTETQKDLDLDSYMGTWYEIAKYPFKYQVKCDRAKAIYRWDKINNNILVENQCFREGTLTDSRTATAWIPDPLEPGKLKIVFDGYPRDNKPGDYWVHWTDYQNAIVGGPSGKFLWWLSRNPKVKAEQVQPMLNKIKMFGYNPERLMAHPSVIYK
jgi:apolipoprotein D and lipocalin family protein